MLSWYQLRHMALARSTMNGVIHFMARYPPNEYSLGNKWVQQQKIHLSHRQPNTSMMTAWGHSCVVLLTMVYPATLVCEVDLGVGEKMYLQDMRPRYMITDAFSHFELTYNSEFAFYDS